MVCRCSSKGVTTSDIAKHLEVTYKHLEVTYGAAISHETIANITDAINDTVKQWLNRLLDTTR